MTARAGALTDRSSRIAYPDSLLYHPDDPDLMFTGGSYTNPANWGLGQPDSALGARRQRPGPGSA